VDAQLQALKQQMQLGGPGKGQRQLPGHTSDDDLRE
jgi:hypothetical protein